MDEIQNGFTDKSVNSAAASGEGVPPGRCPVVVTRQGQYEKMAGYLS